MSPPHSVLSAACAELPDPIDDSNPASNLLAFCPRVASPDGAATPARRVPEGGAAVCVLPAGRLSRNDRAAMLAWAGPIGATVEVWRFDDGAGSAAYDVASIAVGEEEGWHLFRPVGRRGVVALDIRRGREGTRYDTLAEALAALATHESRDRIAWA